MDLLHRLAQERVHERGPVHLLEELLRLAAQDELGLEVQLGLALLDVLGHVAGLEARGLEPGEDLGRAPLEALLDLPPALRVRPRERRRSRG